MAETKDDITQLETKIKNYNKKIAKVSGATSLFQTRRSLFFELFYDALTQISISQFETTGTMNGENINYTFESLEALLYNGIPVPFGFDGNGDLRIFSPIADFNPMLVTANGGYSELTIPDPVNKDVTLKAIDPRTGQGDFVILTNKNIRTLLPYMNGKANFSNFSRLNYDRLSDIPLTDAYANELANIWATSLENSDMMRLPYIIASTDGNMTMPLFMKKYIEGGDKVINVDKSVFQDLDKAIQVLDLKVPDFTASLRAQFDEAMGRFLELRGIFYDDNSKGERQLAREAGGAAQATYLFNDSRLKPREKAFEILCNSIKGKANKLKIEVKNTSVAFDVLAMEATVPDVDQSVGNGKAPGVNEVLEKRGKDGNL